MDLAFPIRSLYRKITAVYWQVAFVDHTLPILKVIDCNVLRFPYCENNWFADPFILNVRKDEIDVIAEEYLKKEQKGIISILTVRREDNVVISKKQILCLDTHLSFPFLYRENGKTYVFPENSASGVHDVYELSANLTMNKIGTVVAEPLVDTAVIKIGKYYYLFGTRVPEQNGSQVMIYCSDSLLGTYKLHQTVAVNKSTARGASGIYPLSGDNHYFRISQDNEGFYGRGLVFQELIFNPINNTFEIKEQYRKYPEFKDRDFVAMHTYNIFDDVAVIDLKKYKHPILGRIVNYIRYKK